MKPKVLLSVLVCVATISLAAADDILCLKDGRVIEGLKADPKPGEAKGPKMERNADGILLTYEHGTVLVPTALIQDAILATDTPPTPTSDEEKQMSEKGMVRFDGKWITPKRREELLAKRLVDKHKELEQVAGRHEWRNHATQETAHFKFEYTVPDYVFEEFRDTMEAYFDEFARAWKLAPPKKEDKLPVCLHADEAAFHQVSGAGYGILGYFKFVRPWDLNIFYERMNPAFSKEVMFHESNHYLQQLLDLHFAMPHFPGESLAEYYGSSEWDPVKKKLNVGLILEGRLCEVQQDITRGEMMELERLVKGERMYEHYTWGWTLVHFLMNDKRYQAKFQNFVFALVRGKTVKREDMGVQGLKTVKGEEVLRTFMTELGLKDSAALKKLEGEWHEYVKALKPASLHGFEEAGMSAAQTGRPIRATRLLKEAIDAGSKSALVFHRYAGVLLGKGKRDEAIAAWKKAIEIDPLNGEFYASLGNAMKRGKKGDEKDAEAERLIALGKDLGYESPWTDIDLSGGDEGKGN